MKKMTKREKFELLLTIEAVAKNEILVEFINHELELLEKKNASSKDGLRKPTATQLENERLCNVIIEFMEIDKDYTITDLQNEIMDIQELSNQKVSSLMKKLVDANKVNKKVEKRKTFFTKSVDNQ